MMENSLALNDFHINKTDLVLNRLHIFLHGIALLALFCYRFTILIQIINNNDTTPLLAYLLVIISELVLSFIWLLSQASKWKPVERNVYPERLPKDEKLPSIDVFVCTADPNKEPSLGVMNTVISALALDYPADKLHVYLSDDGGSSVTFHAVQEAWKFSKWWIPFCRKYEVKSRCPEAYFSTQESDHDGKFSRSEFELEKESIEKRYGEFKESVTKIIGEKSSATVSRDHPPVIRVISGANREKEMPLLVYVAREKRPGHPHHFKAGALNVLLRVSSLISNAPYILVLDCDMYCNDSASARQAMCFYLDTKLSLKLGFVQFPQSFHGINETDIYDGRLRYIWPKWKGMDGLQGPVLSGTGFFINRKALYGIQKIQDVDLMQLQKSFGSSNELIRSIHKDHKQTYANDGKSSDNVSQKEFRMLASCSYDNGTKWGEEVGFRYFAVVEDVFTGFNLHREGWISVYYEPKRPCFLGATPISLSEVLVQNTRWYLGLMQIALSRFSPLVYGLRRMPIPQIMCYAEFIYSAPYFIPLYCLAIVPQLCLVRGIPLYPEVSSPVFFMFVFVFISYQLKHLQEVFSTGHSIKTWTNEQRIWMMKCVTSYFYGSLDATMDKVGLTKAKFLLTNKVIDDEEAKLYKLGKYDFQAPNLFMVPICSLYVLNAASFGIGTMRIWHKQNGNEMFIQAMIPLFGIILFWPLFEGMVLRKDKGRVSPYVSVVSVVIAIIALCFAICM